METPQDINSFEFLESEVAKYEKSDKSDAKKSMDSGNWLRWAITGRAKLTQTQASELCDRVIAVQSSILPYLSQ